MKQFISIYALALLLAGPASAVTPRDAGKVASVNNETFAQLTQFNSVDLVISPVTVADIFVISAQYISHEKSAVVFCITGEIPAQEVVEPDRVSGPHLTIVELNFARSHTLANRYYHPPLSSRRWLECIKQC